jgi:flagellar L-ring protein precursor FlgH
MNRTKLLIVPACSACLALAPAGRAQSFYTRPVEVPVDPTGAPDPSAPLRAVSLLYIDVPQPRQFAVHDQITIIIDETSRSESSQSLDTKKEYDISAGVDEFPDLLQLLELRLEPGERSPLAGVGVSGEQEFKGEGDAERSDRFVARITATVIDVKPNGTLVLEARKYVAHGRESKTIVLSGVCRQEDVTNANTVTSSQLADLSIVQTTEGDLDKASKKGLIPRVLDTLFNF